MLTTSIKQEILAHAERTRSLNPFLQSAASGTLQMESLARYLASLRFMLSLTPQYLRHSRHIAEERGAPGLAAYFTHKLQEEVGHDAWAEADIECLARQFRLDRAPSPVPSILALAQYLHNLIDDDPRLYVAYILWAEFFTVLLGGELVDHLVHRCGVSVNALSAVWKHVELDADHADHGFAEIENLVADPDLLPAVQATMRHFTGLFDQACAEMLAS